MTNRFNGRKPNDDYYSDDGWISNACILDVFHFFQGHCNVTIKKGLVKIHEGVTHRQVYLHFLARLATRVHVYGLSFSENYLPIY